MSDLPTGTVTFVFTDIEGSTRLLRELGDAYPAALEEHRRLLREVFAAHRGVEMDTQGDALFYAFARASDALEAAALGQQGLASGPVRVRIGVHTGEPLLTDGDYVGIDLHVVARIAACGHGGQVVMSRRTKELADVGLLLTDLGEHRLKDLEGPVRLYQVGDNTFPPLRSRSATNLPDPVSSFIGRRRELAEAGELLESGRLVTVTGPGGTGKTRLALWLARAALPEHPDGVWWVPLAELRDAQLVRPSVEQAVGATVGLVEHVAERRMLIVLDNFEHVIPAAADLVPVLAACPNLRMLVTSRELLRITGEREFALAPLADAEAAALFCERAQLPASEAVTELSHQLEGLPLAIELAAARASLLSPAQMLERLSQRLDLFRGGRDADPRHATLRATIEWSHDLLAVQEQLAFARFGIFAGGATLEATEAVAGIDPDLLQSLIDKSLVRRTGDRLWMLDTIRAFAVERLEQVEDRAGLAERHARYFQQLAERANLSDDATGLPDYPLAVADQNNIRAALAWAAATGETELGLRLAEALESFWVINDPREGMRWFDEFLVDAGDVPGEVRAAAYRAYGGVVNPIGDNDLADRLYRQGLAEYRALGDDAGAASLLVRLGHNTWYRGDNESALALGLEGLESSRELGSERTLAQALGLIGELEFERGNHDLGLELLTESMETAAACEFRWWQARMLLRMAKRAREVGRNADASTWAVEALRLAVELDDRRRMVQMLDLLAAIAADGGELARAGLLRGVVEAEMTREPLSAWTMTELPASATADAGFKSARREALELDLNGGVDAALG